MRSTLLRIWSLVGRWRTDRRLPPSVSVPLGDALRLKRRAAVDDAIAAIRPSVERDGMVPVRRGSRTLHAARGLPDSLDTLGHATAERTTSLLIGAGLDPFVVARREDGLEFAIDLEARVDAAAALQHLPLGWHVAYADGRSSGVVAIADLAANRRAMRAREWNVFEAFSWGGRLIGETAGTRISFWTEGTSGQIEKVGERGQARYLAASPRTIENVRGHEYPGRTAFPVGANLEHFDGPIDAVYTWVDGADGRWQAEFRRWSAEDGRPSEHTAFDAARFASRDELRYSLRGLWAYAGWFRSIYVVTAGQVPEWLVEDDRIRIVPHHEILPDDALPTFNSHAIEAALHRIDGLAEHLVYFNDDMFVARPIRPELFFTANGLARVFQSDALVPGAEYDSTIAVDTGALRGRELLRKRFGRVVSGKPYHSPYPLRRSVMEQVEADFPDVVERTQRSRFRAASDLSTAASFSQHYALGLGQAVLGELSNDYAHVESGRLKLWLDRIALSSEVDTFCLNETLHVDGDHGEREAIISQFFDRMYPVPAPWERSEGLIA